MTKRECAKFFENRYEEAEAAPHSDPAKVWVQGELNLQTDQEYSDAKLTELVKEHEKRVVSDLMVMFQNPTDTGFSVDVIYYYEMLKQDFVREWENND